MFKGFLQAKCALAAMAMTAVTTFGMGSALAQDNCGDEAHVMRLGDVATAGVQLPWRMVEALGQDLSQHPALTDYVAQSEGFIVGLGNTDVSPQTLDALISYMQINETVPPEFEQVVGVPPEFFENLGDLLGQVNQMPMLAMMAAPDKTAVMTAAIRHNPAYLDRFSIVQAYDAEAEVEAPDEDGPAATLETCKDDCRDAALAAAEIAEEAFSAELEACQVRTGFRKLFCQAAAGARLTSKLARARHIMEACIEDCNETLGEPDENGDVNTCRRDRDCAPDEFCTSGFLGLGSHECRSKRVVGDRCTRRAQCTSNRCRWGKCR